MKTAVIISTYNSPDWLEKVLWGYASQSCRDFEIVIADDGSTAETKARIDTLRSRLGIPIDHQWHDAPDYQRQKILNQCIRVTTAEYLIFTDGDCIPRRDFVEIHLRHAESGCFVSGGYAKLPMDLSQSITADDITTGRCFELRWLRERGMLGLSQALKLGPGPRLAAILNRITPTKPTWNNCNSSGWRKDILAVNGFDERMKYGGSDRELGARLEHAGIRPKQIRHLGIVLHLDHARGYATAEVKAQSGKVREETIAQRKTWTEYGIVKGKHCEATD